MKEKKFYKKFSFWITLIMLLILIPILIINLVIIYKANKYPNDIPEVFGYKPLIVMSGSMETSIYTGDLIFVKEVAPETLKVGDIIAFREDDDYVTTHRIVGIKDVDGEKCFETKGDNNNASDQNLVEFNNVEGIYVYRIKGLGNLLVFLQKPLGLAVVLLIILIVGLITFSISGRINARKTTTSNEELLKELEQLRKEKNEREKANKK